MRLIEDTGQKLGQHELKHECWKKLGTQVIRCKLPFGDYAVVPPIVVDTKRDIYEIAQNIDQDHERFRNECINARDHGCQLVILIENLDGVRSLGDLAKWRESTAHFRMRGGQRRIFGSRLAKAMQTMADRYGVTFDFCTPNEAAKRVLDILGGDGNDREARGYSS